MLQGHLQYQKYHKRVLDPISDHPQELWLPNLPQGHNTTWAEKIFSEKRRLQILNRIFPVVPYLSKGKLCKISSLVRR